MLYLLLQFEYVWDNPSEWENCNPYKHLIPLYEMLANSAHSDHMTHHC